MKRGRNDPENTANADDVMLKSTDFPQKDKKTTSNVLVLNHVSETILMYTSPWFKFIIYIVLSFI